MEIEVEAKESKSSQLSLFNSIARTLILGIIILVPLAINPFGFQPYSLIKVTIFRTLLFSAALFWLLNIVFKGRLTFSYSRAHLFFLVYLLVTAAATIFSISPQVSFVGWFMRYDGLLSTMTYGLLFLLTYNFFYERERVIDLLQMLMVATFFISIYGYFEFFDFSILPELAVDSSRISSFFGNPGYLGGFLALTIPISATLAVAADKFPKIKWPALVNVVLATPILVLTHTRSAWIGVAVAVVILLVIYFRKIEYKSVIALVLAFVLLGSVLSLGSASSSSTVASKSSKATQVSTDSGARFLYWRVAADAMFKRPILGYGPDTFNYVYAKNRPVDWLTIDTQRAPVDKVHNDLLQVGVGSGFLGLMAYIALLLVIVIGLFKKIRVSDSEENVLVVAAFLGIISYLIFIQAYFTLSELAPIFWIIAAVAISLNDKNRMVFERKLPASISRAVLAIVAIAITAVVIVFAVRAQMADYSFRQGFKLADTGEWSAVSESNRVAVALDSSQFTYQLYLGKSLNNYASINKNEKFFKEAEDTYKTVIRSNPNLVDPHIGLGDTYYNEYKVLGKDTLGKALKAYERADELMAHSPQIKSKIALTLANQKRYVKAIELLNTVIQIDEKDYKNYINLSFAYEESGQIDEAKAILDEALSRWPEQEEIKTVYEDVEKKIEERMKTDE